MKDDEVVDDMQHMRGEKNILVGQSEGIIW
jgi:hypothetical protein